MRPNSINCTSSIKDSLSKVYLALYNSEAERKRMRKCVRRFIYKIRLSVVLESTFYLRVDFRIRFRSASELYSAQMLHG